VQQLPHEQVSGRFAPALLLGGRVWSFDLQLAIADRAHDEARARVVGAQLLEQRGVGDSESHGPQFCSLDRLGLSRRRPPFEGFQMNGAVGEPEDG
jgi:hypothetical protein